ncbi:MAG: hypothetical protein LBH04_11105 [Tannerellaceae bacterium]|nr:hypothetical protein [Tannerellaceae bacterium]
MSDQLPQQGNNIVNKSTVNMQTGSKAANPKPQNERKSPLSLCRRTNKPSLQRPPRQQESTFKARFSTKPPSQFHAGRLFPSTNRPSQTNAS